MNTQNESNKVIFYTDDCLRVFLTREQNQALLNLRTAEVPQKVKDRAEIIRLNAHGWYVEKIAAHFNLTVQTVREVLHKWVEEEF
ncbi:hypothetical protein CDG76_09715 [Nostoc sp. 'Peltigera membranacea cyanobiont' 210A]|nr:hypothetical protein CDG76_09715 [Nostoc sp. 'Peltigera membranacea cyanobiont' 210A]